MIFRNKGFTLMELLITFSIIGLLSIVVITGTTAARKRARVAQRISDLKQVQGALELYYANNRSYPISPGSTYAGTCAAWGGYTTSAMIPGLSPTYIATVPKDPQEATGGGCYVYISNGSDYAFFNTNVTELGTSNALPTFASYPELIDPARDGGASNSIVDGSSPTAWKVSSPGGITW